MNNDLAARQQRYFELSTHLAHVSSEKLRALLTTEEAQEPGWGTNHVIKLAKTRVFVKSMPLTDLERAHMFSTKNLFELPTYYSYGVGSAGFGAFRELVAHIKTTNWVLAGDIANFPLMYHYRILPRQGNYTAVDQARHERYVTYWNSNKQIDTYMTARRDASYELVLFLEHIPYTMHSWLGRNMAKLPLMVNQMRDTITFLRQRHIVHFDVHLGNIVTDGERPYLTDFGLLLDGRFDLSESERAFLRKHTHYDYGELLFGIGWQLNAIYDALSPAKKQKVMAAYGLHDEMRSPERFGVLLQNLEQLQSDGLMQLDPTFAQTLRRNREVIQLHQTFFFSMRQNDRKDNKYQNAKVRRLLKETGFLSG